MSEGNKIELVERDLEGEKRLVACVTVYEDAADEGAGFEFCPPGELGTLNRLIAALCKIRNAIPSEHQHEARCEFGSDGDENGSTATIRISYDRPPDAGETAFWNERKARMAKAAERQERQTYEALKAKFEKPNSKA
jgi:hypothetical protein